MKPPKYYDKIFEHEDPSAHALLKRNRVISAKEWAADNTKARLLIKEQVKLAALTQLKRKLHRE